MNGNRVNPLPKRKKSETEQDELTAIIRYINEECRRYGIEKMAGPWLPELPKWLPFEELGIAPGFDGRMWPERRRDLKIPIGKYDIPANQIQGVMYMDLMEIGHFGIYGSPSTGKTFLLKRILMSIGMYYIPKDVKIYLIDAGKWELKEFAEMPHVWEMVLGDEVEKIRQFVKRIVQEMEARKRAFLKHAVSSLSAYREAVDPDLPAIVIMIEQLKPLLEQYPEMDALINEIAGSGQAFGIYLIFTTNAGASVSYKITQKVKGAISLQQPEKGNYAEIVGSVKDISVPQFQGQALMRGNPPVAFQVAVYADEEKDQERAASVKETIRQMQEAWAELRKEELDEESVDNAGEAEETGESTQTGENAEYSKRTDIPAGTYRDDMEPAYLDLSKKNLCLICSEESEKGKEILARIEKTLRKKEDNLIIRITKDNCKEELPNLTEQLNERQKLCKKLSKEAEFNQDKWIQGYMQICVLIEDISEIAVKLEKDELKRLSMVLNKSKGFGTIIFVSGTKDGLKEQKENVAVSAALRSECILIVDGNPVEYTSLDTQGFPQTANTILDEDEALLLQKEEIRFIHYS